MTCEITCTGTFVVQDGIKNVHANQLSWLVVNIMYQLCSRCLTFTCMGKVKLHIWRTTQDFQACCLALL